MTEKESNPVGRPLKFKTVAELEMAIQAYFDDCDPHVIKHMEATGFNERGQTTWAERQIMSAQRPYLVTGLALALGLSRQALLEYGEREEFGDTVARAKQRCEAYTEGQLFGPYSNGAKFSLNNNFQGKHLAWAERHEVDHTTKGSKIGAYSGLTTEELRKLAEQEEKDDDNQGGDDE